MSEKRKGVGRTGGASTKTDMSARQ